MAGAWNVRQTMLAVVVAIVIGVVGGGAIYAAVDTPDHSGGPGGFGPPGLPQRSQIR